MLEKTEIWNLAIFRNSEEVPGHLIWLVLQITVDETRMVEFVIQRKSDLWIDGSRGREIIILT